MSKRVKVRIDGELLDLPDDDSITLGEASDVAKYTGVDLGDSPGTQKMVGLVFLLLRRKYPERAIVDLVEVARNVKYGDLDVSEDTQVPLPGHDGRNGSSDMTREPSGTPS